MNVKPRLSLTLRKQLFEVNVAIYLFQIIISLICSMEYVEQDLQFHLMSHTQTKRHRILGICYKLLRVSTLKKFRKYLKDKLLLRRPTKDPLQV